MNSITLYIFYFNNCPARCNTKQSVYYSRSSPYMFRVSTLPIIRSTQNCNYSLRYWSYFLCSTSLQRWTPGSRSQPKLRGTKVPGVTPGTHCSGWLRKPGVTQGTRSSRWPSRWHRKPGVPATTGTRSWGRVRGPGVMGGTGNTGWIREPRIPGQSGNPEFRLIPRICGWIREPGVNRNFRLPGQTGLPGDPGKTEFWVIPENRCSILRVTPGTRRYEWIRKPAVPVTPRNRSSRWYREAGLMGDVGNSEWLRNQLFLVT